MIKLTRREKQVCDLLVLGNTNKEVAMSLGLSWRTVDDYRHSIFEKYGVSRMVHLVRKVYRLDQPSHMQAAE